MGSDSDERKTFRFNFYELIRCLLRILKGKTTHFILLGDFNTTSSILDSAYMLNDVQVNGFVDWFRSMSDWLEDLLLSPTYTLSFRDDG